MSPVKNNQDPGATGFSGPALNKSTKEKRGVPRRARVSQRKPQRFARLRMVVGEILQDVRGSVSHVRHTDRRGCRLRIDELAYVFQLRTEAGVGSVIDQDEELKS